MQTLYKFIIGAEYGVALWGLVVLCSGVAPFPQRRRVQGTRARIIGLVAILPRLISMFAGYLWASVVAYSGWQFTLEDITFQGMMVEGILLLLALGMIFFLGSRWACSPTTAPGTATQRQAIPNADRE